MHMRIRQHAVLRSQATSIGKPPPPPPPPWPPYATCNARGVMYHLEPALGCSGPMIFLASQLLATLITAVNLNLNT